MKKLWGGRFTGKTDPAFERFSASIETDYRLVKCDLIGSFLHVHVLKEAGLITARDLARFKTALASLLRKAHAGVFPFDFSSEDIHTNIQNALAKALGALAGKLQTCRSRNDQVVFATKLYCLFAGAELQELIFGARKSLLALGALYDDVRMPGYTHMQHAQPVPFRDHVGAFSLMLERDAVRLENALKEIGLSQGSGALAGTPIAARHYKAGFRKGLKALGMPGLSSFIGIPDNTLKTVSDRDFVIELAAVLAMAGVHLSRLAEDLILWSTREFGFITLGDAYCTGSSLMPQKKNPDALELIRGAAGILTGNVCALLTMMKGLPLTYNRDMQWDKTPLFQSLDIVRDALTVLTGCLKTVKVDRARIAAQMADEGLYATALADLLVGKGVAFAEAHAVVGRMILYCADEKKSLRQLSQAQLTSFSPKLQKEEVARVIRAA
ncbi:MAG: argininosuccinate lyase [Deltaproteobacteria bacterium]